MRTRAYSFNSAESQILWFPSLGSTNDTAKELAETGQPEGTCVIADEQTRGRGRQGRTWHSPAGTALYLSLILRPKVDPEKLQLLTLTCAIATAETAREFLNAESALDIKWPNDLLLDDRKLSGILVESAFEGNCIKYAIVGIGVNLNQTGFPDDLVESATSLRSQTGVECDLEGFAIRLLGNLGRWYSTFQQGASETIITRLGELSSFVTGKTVTVDLGNETINGITSGLTETGCLKLTTDAGSQIVVSSGEIVKLRS